MAKDLPDLATLSACPHCQGNDFFINYQCSGPSRKYRTFNGESADNSTMWDRVSLKPGKLAYCAGCHVPIATYDGHLEGR